jgi:ribosomal protein S12 methylthiotransferase accessory factor
LVSPRYGLVTELALVDADPDEPSPPFVVQAQLANHRYLSREQASQFSASGKGFTMERAMEGALGEAVERYAASFWWPDEIRRARRADLPGRALDPRELVLFAPAQYGTLPYRPYAEDLTLAWVEAHSLTADRSVWVPGAAVFLAFPTSDDETMFAPTSNGLAAGPSRAHAILAAAFEVIERDAVMIGWLQRVCLDRWDPSGHPDADTRRLVTAYERRGVEVGLFRMPTDLDEVAVFLAIARDPRRAPAAVVGLGADFDPAAAAARAIGEIAQVRPALKRKLRLAETQARLRELLEDPRRVTSIHDHDLLYADPSSLARLEFLFARRIDVTRWPGAGEARGLEDLVRMLKARGHELIYRDVSVPDLERLGLFVARAILPGFQPIDFGWHERRLGGRRLYELPISLGLLPRPRTVDELNADPHPIA